MLVKVELSERLVVEELWAPHELHSLKPEINVLDSKQKSLSIEEERYKQLRSSLLTVPFELLHQYWKTVLLNSVESDRCINAPIHCTCTSVSCVLMTYNNDAVWSETRRHDNTNFSASISKSSNSNSSSGIDTIMEDNCKYDNHFIDNNNITIADSAIAEQSKMSGCFVFTTTYPHITYSVYRSPIQLMTFVSALAYSFPHLLIPADTVCSLTLAQAMCQFMLSHRHHLQTYMPFLYFSFETNESKSLNFFKSLETLVRQNKLYENNTFQHLKPAKTSSWLSWSSSKPKVVVEGEKVMDLDTFALQHRQELPNIFAESYDKVKQRHVLFARLRKELQTMESLIHLESHYKDISQLISGKLANQHEKEVTSPNRGNESKLINDEQVENALKQFKKSFLSTTTVKDMLIKKKKMLIAKQILECIAMWLESIYYYLLEYLRVKQKVIESDDLVSQVQPLPKTCAAATNPALFDEIIKLYCAYTRIILITEQHMEHEINAVYTTIEELEAKLISIVHIVATCEEVIDEHTSIKEYEEKDVNDKSNSEGNKLHSHNIHKENEEVSKEYNIKQQEGKRILDEDEDADEENLIGNDIKTILEIDHSPDVRNEENTALLIVKR